MEVPFIMMTIAFVIMLIVVIIQNITIERLKKTNRELLNKKGKKCEDCEFYHQNDPDYPDNCEYPDNPPCLGAKYYEP